MSEKRSPGRPAGKDREAEWREQMTDAERVAVDSLDQSIKRLQAELTQACQVRRKVAVRCLKRALRATA